MAYRVSMNPEIFAANDGKFPARIDLLEPYEQSKSLLGQRRHLVYVPEPPACTMEPDGWYGEEYGVYKCSNCGELWQFDCDGPKEHGWACCPRCASRITYEASE